MPASVSALQEEVRSEQQAWPFQLDIRRDIATIQLSGVVYRTRPLRWREKRNLARYAQVGEEFLRRYMMKACLVDDAPLPEAQDEYEGLWALTQWINTPGDEQAGLPLDATLLAGVGTSVAQQLGVKPSELSHEKAEFVEALWTSLRTAEGVVGSPAQAAKEPDAGSAAVAHKQRVPFPSAAAKSHRLTPTLPHPGDMNRIRVVPDPPAVQSTVVASESDVESAGNGPARFGSDETATLDPLSSEAANGHALPNLSFKTSAFSASQSARVNVPASDALVSHSSVAKCASGSPVSQPDVTRAPGYSASQRVTRQAGQFRVRMPGDPHAATLPAVSPSERQSPSAWNPEPGATQTASVESAITAPTRAKAVWTYQTSERATEPAGLTAPSLENSDDLFEEFADRLEQAAEQMGIDL